MDQKLARAYNADSACVGYSVEWNGAPTNDLFCSPNQDAKLAIAEITIFKATIYKKVLCEGMGEMVDLLQNNNNDLSNCKMNGLRRQKYVAILNEIKMHKYEEWMSKQSQDFSNHALLKGRCAASAKRVSGF